MIKVAIVDDNEIFLREMRQIVESCSGFMADMVCDTYTSGIDFLRVGCGAYQLVILDMQIEGKNGYETAKKLRESDDSVVIAFISGVVFPEPKHFRVQPYRYLLKNADSEEIRRDVEELLQETKERYLNETVEVTGDGRAWRVNFYNLNQFISLVVFKKHPYLFSVYSLPGIVTAASLPVLPAWPCSWVGSAHDPRQRAGCRIFAVSP